MKIACPDTNPGGMYLSPRFPNATQLRAHAWNTKKSARRSGCFSELWRSNPCIRCRHHRARKRINRKGLGGSTQAAPLGTFNEASPETRADPVGPYLFRGHPYIAYRGNSGRRNFLGDAVVPSFGFCFCFVLLIS